MLPKSSQRVAAVIKIANTIAREYDQEYVGTEHVLLAIEREGTGIGAKVLAKHGITAQRLRDQVDLLVKKSLEETWVFGRLPGTPHFKNVIATAIDQCQKLRAGEVCTEHVLLALMKESGCIARTALKALGLTYDELCADIAEHSSKTDTAARDT